MLLNGFKYTSGFEYILMNLHDLSTKAKTEHAVDLNSAIAAQEDARHKQDAEAKAKIDWKKDEGVLDGEIVQDTKEDTKE